MQYIGILLAIAGFLFLIMIHEGGHFLMAKLCNIHAPEFSIGFGPLVYETNKGGTQYSVRALPLGGYCRFSEEDEKGETKDILSAAPWYKQLLILLAGPFCNVLLCLLILFAVFLFNGFTTTTLAEVVPGGPAAAAGIEVGDQIISVDGQTVASWDDFQILLNAPGATGEIGILRDGEELHMQVSPQYSEEYERYLVGVTCKVMHSPVLAAKMSFYITKAFFLEMRDMLVSLVRGHMEDVQVSGVVGIVSVVSEEAKYGLLNVIYLLAIISLNLGVMNLLPIPALDGGRILLVLVKAVSGNRIPQNYIDTIHGAGMLLLWALMIFLVFKDTFNLIFK